MINQFLIMCLCGNFYISKKEKSQCSKCGARNFNDNPLSKQQIEMIK